MMSARRANISSEIIGSGNAIDVDLLDGYALYYVNDYCGQKIRFGDTIGSPEKIDWVCNLFAVPATESAGRRWMSVLQRTGRVRQYVALPAVL